MTVNNELIDRLLADYKKPEDLIGENGLLKQLTKRLVERALEAEMSEHLGHDKNKPVANARGNTRNGKSKKTLKGEFGELPIDIPRDRDGSFEPQIVPKHQTRWTGFDDKILSLYARGMTVREIQGHLEEMYGAEVSPTLISTVTDAVMDEAKAWQARPLDALYPIVYLDCIHVKSRDAGVVKVKAVYLALGIDLTGNKQLLGLWIAQTEGAKFWMKVSKDLKTRGVNVRGYRTVDGGRAADIEFVDAALPASALLGGHENAGDAIDETVHRAIAALSADAVGAMTALVTATVEYTKTRVQFGQPIAKFQVLQHRCAEMFIHIDSARSHVYRALGALGLPPAERRRAVSMCKVGVSQAARFVGSPRLRFRV